MRSNPAYLEQLEQRLEDHRGFWAGMGDAEGPAPSFRALSIVGEGREVREAWRLPDDRPLEFTDAVFADGDGTVLVSRTTPPTPITAEIWSTGAEHSYMLNDRGVREKLREFVAAP